jgi:hypothetical protein
VHHNWSPFDLLIMLSQPPEDAAGQISDRADHHASSPVALGAIRGQSTLCRSHTQVGDQLSTSQLLSAGVVWDADAAALK